MTDKVFYRLLLSDNPGDVEVVGGAPNQVQPFLMASEQRLVPFNMVSEDEARNIIADEGYGAGVFISTDVDIKEDEQRREKALDCLIYLSVRLGRGTLYQPLELEGPALRVN